MSDFSLSIIVKKDIEKDISLILDEFYNQKSDHFKKRIIRFYKSLESKIGENPNKEKETVENFFREIYRDKQEQIDKIIEESDAILKNQAQDCLAILAGLMDYKMDKNEEFIAIPTLLPFSPFNRPIFNFSIVSPLFLKEENEILDIAIHEISHFMLFDILKNLNINLWGDTEQRNFLHLFKEALTGMLLSEEQMEKLLGRKGYQGNPEVCDLYIKDEKIGEVILGEYLRIQLYDHKKNNLSFFDFIKDMIEKLSPQIKEFSEKKIFWDKNERELKGKNVSLDLLEEYKKPIFV